MWLCLYLSDRLLYVRVRNNLSPVSLMKYSVPQASVLGLIIFLLYIADLVKLIKSYGLSVHLYADDTQIQNFSSPSSVDQLQIRMSTCIVDDCPIVANSLMQSAKSMSLSQVGHE